jgi:hypothetical protein
MIGRLSSRLTRGTENDSRFLESTDQLRRVAAQLPPHRLRHVTAGEKEPEHSYTERLGACCLLFVDCDWLTLDSGIVSAPLWDSKSSTFAGLLTTSDYINVIQYYWQNPDALGRVDQFRLNSLRGASVPSCSAQQANRSRY